MMKAENWPEGGWSRCTRSLFRTAASIEKLLSNEVEVHCPSTLVLSPNRSWHACIGFAASAMPWRNIRTALVAVRWRYSIFGWGNDMQFRQGGSGCIGLVALPIFAGALCSWFKITASASFYFFHPWFSAGLLQWFFASRYTFESPVLSQPRSLSPLPQLYSWVSEHGSSESTVAAWTSSIGSTTSNEERCEKSSIPVRAPRNGSRSPKTCSIAEIASSSPYGIDP